MNSKYDLESYLATYNSKQTAFVLNIEIKYQHAWLWRGKSQWLLWQGLRMPISTKQMLTVRKQKLIDVNVLHVASLKPRGHGSQKKTAPYSRIKLLPQTVTVQTTKTNRWVAAWGYFSAVRNQRVFAVNKNQWRSNINISGTTGLNFAILLVFIAKSEGNLSEDGRNERKCVEAIALHWESKSGKRTAYLNEKGLVEVECDPQTVLRRSKNQVLPEGKVNSKTGGGSALLDPGHEESGGTGPQQERRTPQLSTIFKYKGSRAAAEQNHREAVLLNERKGSPEIRKVQEEGSQVQAGKRPAAEINIGSKRGNRHNHPEERCVRWRAHFGAPVLFQPSNLLIIKFSATYCHISRKTIIQTKHI